MYGPSQLLTIDSSMSLGMLCPAFQSDWYQRSTQSMPPVGASKVSCKRLILGSPRLQKMILCWNSVMWTHNGFLRVGTSEQSWSHWFVPSGTEPWKWLWHLWPVLAEIIQLLQPLSLTQNNWWLWISRGNTLPHGLEIHGAFDFPGTVC